jgi:hypothetical protein
MMESLIAVAQESPALYLNNGVLLSDMKNMAETLFLALRSVTGKLHHPLLELNFLNCSLISVPSYLLCRSNVNVIG